MNFKWELFKSLEDREVCWSNMPQNSQGSSRMDEKKQSPGVLTNARLDEIVPSPASAHPK